MTTMTVLRPRTEGGYGTDTRDERVLDRLRYETRPYAIRLHRHDWGSHLATRADYAATLVQLLGFYRPLDRWLSAALVPSRFELALLRRAKAPLIARDLAALAVNQSPVRFNPPPLRTGVPYALGWLYGVEIAGLGGRIIGKRLSERLNIGPTDGGMFFEGYGADSHAMSERLGTVITRRITGEADCAAAQDGAVDFFEALLDWLSLPRLSV